MRSNSCSEPFATIAPYYDRLMSFVNYPGWIAYIEKIIELNRVRQDVVLDIACGTGTCLQLWAEKGRGVIGLDRSRAMLEVCRRRLAAYPDVRLMSADMRQFALAQPVGVITCLYDSLNYLLTEADLLACFHSVRAALRDDGVFIFDMNTIHSLRDEWGSNTFQRRDEGLFSIWSNQYDAAANISSLNIRLHVRRNGEELVLEEFHQERGYPVAAIEGLLREAGFESALYRHLTFTPASELDLRIMGVARK